MHDNLWKEIIKKCHDSEFWSFEYGNDPNAHGEHKLLAMDVTWHQYLCADLFCLPARQSGASTPNNNRAIWTPKCLNGFHLALNKSRRYESIMVTFIPISSDCTKNKTTHSCLQHVVEFRGLPQNIGSDIISLMILDRAFLIVEDRFKFLCKFPSSKQWTN